MNVSYISSFFKALEEFSAAVVEERDYVSAQLKQKETEIEQEKRLRQELMDRLTALQQHVRNNIRINNFTQSTEHYEY